VAAILGPDGIAEVRGQPALAKVPTQVLNQVVAARFWQVSEVLTGVTSPHGG